MSKDEARERAAGLLIEVGSPVPRKVPLQSDFLTSIPAGCRERDVGAGRFTAVEC